MSTCHIRQWEVLLIYYFAKRNKTKTKPSMSNDIEENVNARVYLEEVTEVTNAMNDSPSREPNDDGFAQTTRTAKNEDFDQRPESVSLSSSEEAQPGPPDLTSVMDYYFTSSAIEERVSCFLLFFLLLLVLISDLGQ